MFLEVARGVPASRARTYHGPPMHTRVHVAMPVKGAGPRRRGNLVRGNLRCNSRWQSCGEAVQGDLSKPVVERGKVPVDFVGGAKSAQGTCQPPRKGDSCSEHLHCKLTGATYTGTFDTQWWWYDLIWAGL